MTKSPDINLLRAKTMLTPQMLAVEGQLRTVSVAFLILLFSSGMFFGLGSMILGRKYQVLSGEKQSVIAAISGYLPKESVYVAIKDRLGVLGRIMEKQPQRRWQDVMEQVARITGRQTGTSFGVSETYEVRLDMKDLSFEESFAVVDRLREETLAKKMMKPVLESIRYQKDGTVHLTVSFTPVF